MKDLVEERGGVLLEKASGLDAEHVIRFSSCAGKIFSFCKFTIKVVGEDRASSQ